jgi:hypothetical protein
MIFKAVREARGASVRRFLAGALNGPRSLAAAAVFSYQVT